MEAIISADSHIAEVEACYADIDPRFRDRRPRPADDPQVGAYFAIPDFPMKVPMGSVCRAGTPPEKWNVPIHWDELHPAGWDPRARLAIQDEEQVQAEVIYPSVGLMLHLHPDLDYKKACFDAYNRWLVQFCATAPERLIGIGMATLRTVEEGIRELEQLKAMGFRGVMLPGQPAVEDYHHRCYDPLWQAFVDHGMAVHFHILTARDSIGVQVRGPQIIQQIVTVRGNQNVAMMMILSGVFERHPDLRVVLVENDAGWIPHFSFRMDHAWERHRWWMEVGKIPRKPSEYMDRNIYATFQDDYSVRHVVNAINVERVMWATDFPHGDGTYPRSREIIDDITRDMTAAQRRAIVHDNAAALYGLA
jgi:predicted TIM-barrel fold metal-dependent hydrolase